MAGSKQRKQVRVEVMLFKSLIYLFLIIVAYKIATAIAVSFGFFPKDQMPGLAVLILAPLYWAVLLLAFLGVSVVLLLFAYLFFKRSELFRKMVDNTESAGDVSGFVFWMLLAFAPYATLPFFDIYIEKNREEGYVNRKAFAEKNAAYYREKQERYKKEVLTYTKERALALVKEDGSKLKFLSDTFKKDKGIVYAAINQDPNNGLKYADPSFSNNKEVVLMAVARDASALCEASDMMKKDRDVVLRAMHSVKHSIYSLMCSDKRFRGDKEIMLEAIKYFPQKALFMADSRLKKDRDFVLASVKRAGLTLSAADKSFKKDRELVLEAVRQSGHALESVDESLKKDREVVMTALRTNGGALRHATDEQRADKAFVLTAVKYDDEFREALKYADMRLTDDKEVALAAVRHNGLALQHVSMRLKYDKEVISVAIKQNRHAIVFVPKSLQSMFR